MVIGIIAAFARSNVFLSGFNSFSGNVALQNLQLPGDDPAGGIKFVAETSLVNPR